MSLFLTGSGRVDGDIILLVASPLPHGLACVLCAPPFPLPFLRWRGFKYAFLSGLAEPAAVVLLGLVFPNRLDQVVVDCLLAAGVDVQQCDGGGAGMCLGQ